MILQSDIESVIRNCLDDGNLETLRDTWLLLQEAYYGAAGCAKPGQTAYQYFEFHLFLNSESNYYNIKYFKAQWLLNAFI